MRVTAAFIWPTLNDVRTGATPEYPELRPQRFAQPFDRVFAAAAATAREMELEITAQSPEKGELQAIATTRIMRFKDDVTISLARDGQAVTVNMRSKSRIGKGDLGANARRIRDFQARLAEKLK